MVLANNMEGRGKKMLLPCAIYSAFAIVSAMLERSGCFVVAGCVLLIAAVVMSIYFYQRDQSFVSFRFLLSLFWTAGEGLAVMQLSHLQSPWTVQTWLSFSGFYLLFLVGYEIVESKHKKQSSDYNHEASSKIQNKKQNRKGKEALLDPTQEARFQERLFTCIRIVSLVTFATFIAEACILGYIPLFSSVIHAYDHFHITGVHYFTVSCMFTHSLTLIYLLKYRQKGVRLGKSKTIQLIIYNILSASIPILSVSKFQFILTLALPMIIFLLMRPNVNKKKLFAVFGTIAVVTIAVAVFMTIRRNYEPGYLNSIFQMKDENMPLFAQYAYMYIANNYSNFNCLTQAFAQGTITHAYGLKQLFPVFALTGMKFVFPSLVAFEMPVTIKELNTLTLIYDAYYDFGLIGVLLFGLILGLICAGLTKKIKQSSNPILYLLYAQVALYLVLSFFSAWFTVPTTWFWFALTGVLYWYTGKK